jgi:3-keto-5-aminohexanoate cleavage enzyme
MSPGAVTSQAAPARKPVIIEAAINGARGKKANPHVPLSCDEIVECVSACVEAGASIIHVHAGQPIVGSGGHHDSAVYKDAFAQALARHPGLLLYPTLPSGGPGTSMEQRLAHVTELCRMGLAAMVPVDPGTMNFGHVSREGRPPVSDRVYQTTFADVDWTFRYCREQNLFCTISAFEPGFIRLVEAHRRAGTLPLNSLVKLEFCTGDLLFGLTPDLLGLHAWLSLFDCSELPWMVTLRNGNVNESLAELAISRDGHVRVGLEDYAGRDRPTNQELVAAAATIARRYGRRPALPQEARDLMAGNNKNT